MNIEMTAGISGGEECAGCFTINAKGKACLHLRIKKVKLFLVTTEKNEELCIPCGVELLTNLGRQLGEAQKLMKSSSDEQKTG